jgi:hypothetical protein
MNRRALEHILRAAVPASPLAHCLCPYFPCTFVFSRSVQL